MPLHSFYRSQMDRDHLFVQKVDWLDAVVRRVPLNLPELLIASGQLRLLLTDKKRLIDQVNATRNFDIRFRILSQRDDLPPVAARLTLRAAPDGISPSLAAVSFPNHTVPTLTLRLDAFLQERIMIFRDEDITVLDLIKFLSHVAGGVHAGDPESGSGREAKLAELSEMVLLGIEDLPTRCLRGVAAVVVEALRPLRDAIAKGG